MSDLVKRLRDSVFEVAEVVSMEKLKKLNSCAIEAADRIEKLERELRECRMQSISDDAQYQMLADQLAAEKALADRLYSGTDNWADRNAYRKARGL